MRKRDQASFDAASLDELVEEITVDANGEDELRPKDAIRHYEAGLRIGELSIGEGFHGVLPWGWIDNRPLLRCMNGFGLCLWRLGRFDEAGRVFDRMLWLNPSETLKSTPLIRICPFVGSF